MPGNKTHDRSRSSDRLNAGRQQRGAEAVPNANQQELVLQDAAQAGVNLGLQAAQLNFPIQRVQEAFLQGLRNGKGMHQASCNHHWVRVFPPGPRDNGETDGRKCIKCDLYEA